MNRDKSYKISPVILLVLFVVFAISGCSLFFKDKDAPVPNSKVILVKNVTGTTATVSWQQASDDTTPQNQIIYYLYYSTQNNMQVLDDVKSANFALKGTYSKLAGNASGEMEGAISGLLPGSIYYINVIAEDASGNEALYSQVNISMCSDSFSGGNYEIFKHGTIDTSVDSSIEYTINLNSSVKDMYFIFSNLNRNNDSTKPSIRVQSSVKGERVLSGPVSPETTKNYNMAGPEQPAVYMGRPDVTEFNNSPIKNKPPSVHKSLGGNQESTSTIVSDKVNDTRVFYDLDCFNKPIPVDATCRAVFTDTGGTGKTLNIWVADDCWGAASGKANYVTQKMVDNLQANFLKSGAANDVYDWVTAIFGEEWGTHSQSNLIAPDDNITILLYDIDNDNSTKGGVLGFFWAKDNYKKTPLGTDPVLHYSNQRIMFYIDAVLYAEPDSKSNGWKPTDYWPKETVSTLAHEFQHMIHFYQHDVLRKANTETWINELCSMMTEDIVSDKIGTPGPRGVDPSDPTAGSSGLTGRLNRYNYRDYLDVTSWLSGNNVLYSYSMAYSFGAYLVRNFGGAVFLKNLVQNSENNGWDMVSYALRQAGNSNDSMGNRLGDWAAAAILSDFTDPPQSYEYNTGTWFPSSAGGISYNLGSINMYNYTFSGVTGPFVFDSTNYDSITKIEANSNIIYRAGKDLTGKNTFLIGIPGNTELTVIVR